MDTIGIFGISGNFRLFGSFDPLATMTIFAIGDMLAILAILTISGILAILALFCFLIIFVPSYTKIRPMFSN